MVAECRLGEQRKPNYNSINIFLFPFELLRLNVNLHFHMINLLAASQFHYAVAVLCFPSKGIIIRTSISKKNLKYLMHEIVAN